jgi:GntR family transcriptional regulator
MPAVPVDPYLRKHAYAQVADDVARRIGTGEIARKLPAERALAEEYEVSYVTVRHAMKILRESGLIVTIHGRGTFVASSLDRDPQGDS